MNDDKVVTIALALLLIGGICLQVFVGNPIMREEERRITIRVARCSTLCDAKEMTYHDWGFNRYLIKCLCADRDGAITEYLTEDVP